MATTYTLQKLDLPQFNQLREQYGVSDANFSQYFERKDGSIYYKKPTTSSSSMLGDLSAGNSLVKLDMPQFNQIRQQYGVSDKNFDQYFVRQGDSIYLKPGAGVQTNQPIDASKLSGSYKTLSDILGTTVTPDMVPSDIAGLLALQNKTSAEEQAYTGLQQKFTDVSKLLGTQGQELKAELDKQGVPQAYEKVKELNLRGAQLQGELQSFDAQTEAMKAKVEDQPIPTSLITGQQAQIEKQRSIIRLSKAAELASTAALSQAYQGNATLGSQLAQQAVDIKFQPILNEIDTLKTQIGFAGEALSRSDSKRANIINVLLDLKYKEIEDQKARESAIEQVAVEAARNGASLDVVNSIRNSGDVVSATKTASYYLDTNVQRRQDLEDAARQFEQDKQLAAFKASLTTPTTPPSQETFRLSSSQVSSMLGVGFTQQDIQNFETNIQNGVPIPQIIDSIPGLSDNEKKTLYGAFGQEIPAQNFLSQDYFKNIFTKDQLKASAKKAGFTAGGFLGIGVGDQGINDYLDYLMKVVEQYRKAGLSDSEILDKMNKK
jgi:hypothetical protein